MKKNNKMKTIVEPWECLIIDDFLPPSILENVLNEESKLKKYFSIKNHPWKIKYRVVQNNELYNYILSSKIHKILEKKFSKKFRLRELSAIQFRKMSSSSPELPPHHDFVDSDQDVVMIIYLNKKWKKSDQGELVLMSSKNRSKSHDYVVEPIFNRAVLFQTSKKNIHRVDKFLGQSRISLICEWIPEGK